ncbi:MAG: AAA family ATPase [Anaerolineae bacterium]|nr:SMC family ATPase [Thermoplasmata archaeon]NIV34229.1 AAA family ATPase [Anaerolineae bacterium]NIY06077.1 AAA family ATPase [Thermoplasmata archaeon]
MSNYRLRFTRLTGHNVCSYPDFDIDLTNKGSVLVTGVNGSGKSTPWYALTHLLYWMTPKGLKYKELINIHDPKDYHLRLELEIDGVPYAIEEFREHTLHGACRIIWRNGKDITPKGDQATKIYIPELLNLDQQSFLSNVFLSQEHTHVLVDGKPLERQKHVMWLFGLNAFEELAGAAKKERDALKGEIANVERIQEEIKDIEAQLKKLPTKTFAEEQLETAKADRESLESEITVLEGRRSRLADKVSKVEVRDGLVDELRELAMDESPTATDVADLSRQVSDMADALATTKSDLSLARKAEELRDELANYRELPPVEDLRRDLERVQEEKLRATEVTLPQAQRAARLRTKLNKIARDEVDKLEDLEDRENELQNAIKKLTRRVKDTQLQLKKGVCPTCKRPWEMSEDEIKELEATLTDARSSLDDTNKRYYAVHARAEDARQVGSLRRKLEKLPEEDPQDVEIEIADLVRQEKALRADLTVAEEREEIRAKLQDAPKEPSAKLRQRVKKLTGDLADLRQLFNRTKQAHNLLRQIAKLPQGDLKQLKRKLVRVEESLQESRRKVNDLAELVANTQSDLREVERLMDTRRDKREVIHKARSAIRDSRIWDTLREGFGHLLRARERKLLQRISKELPTYFNPLFGEQSQWCQAELCKEGGGGVDIMVRSNERLLPPKGPSPGMKAKLGISLLFALRDLYAQNQCNLIVLDEPLWKIDQEARPAFLEILDQLRQKVETLIITTHEQEIKGHAFDHRWEATIENGLSTLHC